MPDDASTAEIGWGDRGTPAEARFGVATLALVAGDPQRQERLAALRDTTFSDRDLIVFGARTASTWVLDVLAGRFTNHAHDWQSLRAAILDFAGSERTSDHILDAISLDNLYGIADVLHEREIDNETERALLQLISDRAVAGEGIHKQNLAPLSERLLQFGIDGQARALLSRLSDTSWVSHAISVELEHPRFGGSYETALRLLNEPYRRVGLEPVALGDSDGTAFDRLQSATVSPVTDGPLVSIIMTCFAPGPEIFTAVRSLIAQSYQNWELIVTDDASPRGIVTVLKQVAALDPRIRIIRNKVNAGPFVRRNEALQTATGEFVTMQDAAGWSHPRRLEIQVHDLMSNPGRVANVVKGARVTADLSLVSRPGSKLFVSESSLMFRREETISTIGYFDSVRHDADYEFRGRLERGAGLPVPTILPGAPLEFLLDRREELSDTEYGLNLWSRPARLMYLSGAHRYLQRIEADAQSPMVTFPASTRPFASPASWTDEAVDAPLTYDLVVVLDGREFSKLREFHETVAKELAEAASADLRVAVMQSYSLSGPRGYAHLAPALQDLVDKGRVARIDEENEVQAELVVVRHAGAVQGHRAQRSAVTALRTVVVEDASAGDVRGRTFARLDVNETVTAWFGVEPTWELAAPALPPTTVASIAFDDRHVELTIGTGVPRSVREVRLKSGTETIVLEPSISGPEAVLCRAESKDLHGREWSIDVEFDAGAGRVLSQPCPVLLSSTIVNDATHVAVRTENDGLIFLSAQATDDLPASAAFAREFLSASAAHVAVANERFQVSVAAANAASVSRVYALRQVEAGVIRRRDFTLGSSPSGERVWERPLSKFAESRWNLYGTFRTPLGLVEYPIELEEGTPTSGTDSWAPQVLSRGRVLVAPPLPSRMARATHRVTRVVSSAFGDIASRRASSDVVVEKIAFNATHSEPRTEAPTVTVVMPVYNVEPFLDVAISSVLDQEFTDLELILIDDASTDNGRHIIRKYWEKDPRVRVFALDHNTIGGAGVPSNIGIHAARGEYVAFADSDDHVTPGGLARLVSLAETHEAELVIGDFKTFSEKLPEGAESYDRAIWDELPGNKPISAFTHPALFRLSPVPWRKLYRRSFLQEHAIVYPEGDYFYEDNPLHWFVLSRAHRVVMCDEVISYHRMEREGQTMSAATYKLGAFVNHMNTILNFLASSTDANRDVLFEAFFNYMARTNWVAKNQTQPAANALIRYGMNGVYQRARAAAPGAAVAPELRARLASYGDAYPDLDLTVVIPVYNSADLLKQTVDSVLSMSGLKYNVILVDDGSTDDSLTMMQDYENANANVHVFAQGNRGAGRARNSVIPLCTGRYTYFLDADDVIDPEALAAAVAHADAEAADLLFVEYRIEFADEGRTEGMYKADREVWRKLRGSTRHSQRQQIAAQLINYPWNRIIRTSLLHDANIFFGATVVNNDVQYHWHSIASAQRISFLDVAVASHRKFATREQVTNIQDARRMAVLEALRSTHERIAATADYDNIRAEWEKFALHLMAWAKDRIPESLQGTYQERRAELTRAFTAR